VHLQHNYNSYVYCLASNGNKAFYVKLQVYNLSFDIDSALEIEYELEMSNQARRASLFSLPGDRRLFMGLGHNTGGKALLIEIDTESLSLSNSVSFDDATNQVSAFSQIQES